MPIHFRLLLKTEYSLIVPLLEQLNNYKIPKAVLAERVDDMKTPNHECAAIFDDDKLIGVCGMWFCTRHYSGRSVEVDHVFIDEAYRGEGLGKQFFEWIYNYTKEKGYETMELNTYVSNSPSHKFYYNEGFKILGFHFLKQL